MTSEPMYSGGSPSSLTWSSNWRPTQPLPTASSQPGYERRRSGPRASWSRRRGMRRRTDGGWVLVSAGEGWPTALERRNGSESGGGGRNAFGRRPSPTYRGSCLHVNLLHPYLPACGQSASNSHLPERSLCNQLRPTSRPPPATRHPPPPPSLPRPATNETTSENGPCGPHLYAPPTACAPCMPWPPFWLSIFHIPTLAKSIPTLASELLYYLRPWPKRDSLRRRPSLAVEFAFWCESNRQQLTSPASYQYESWHRKCRRNPPAIVVFFLTIFR